MRRARAVLLTAASVSVIAAAAWAQQAYYPQKPSPAVPAGQQAMSYDQALRLQQSWNGSGRNQAPAAAPYASDPGAIGATGSAEAAPIGVDPDGNTVFSAAPGTATQSRSGNASQNEAQIAADRMRQNPDAASQPSYQDPQQTEAYNYAPQAPQPEPQYAQPQYQQPQYQQSQPQYEQPYASQGQPYGYAAPNAPPTQQYGYAQPAPQVVQAPPAVAYGYPAPPPPPVAVYPYPYGYGAPLGGYYRGYPYRGGYYRGYPVVRGGFAIRGYIGGPRGGVYLRGYRR